MQRSKLPYFILALSAVISLASLGLLVSRSGVVGRLFKPAVVKTPPPATTREPGKTDIPNSAQPVPGETAESTLKDLGLATNPAEADPEALVNKIAKALEADDPEALTRLMGRDVCDEATLARLKALANGKPLRVRQPDGIREVGELEINTRTRWSLDLDLDGAEPGRGRIYLDLAKGDGLWKVDRLTLPPAPGEPVPRALLADPLGTADAFVQAVAKQDFEFARDFVDPKTVSDVKIATLCILFEEGNYHLRKSKPLRAMFRHGDTSGYIARLESLNGGAGAEVAISLRQPSPNSNWLVSEINLDKLLADYARRIAGGDAYYSPLVKNPQGGDTLALYFEFNEDAIGARTRRQLDIIAHILRADPGKKITLSGHTDALGTKEYNDMLSARRADAVRDFLTRAGVSASQIVTYAKGYSQPRRPNVTETGADNPRGRRANRRTEIYLDF